jgi:hypothetical protein
LTCRAGFLPVLIAKFEAIVLWNRRSGGVSALGGKATKGITSRKKRRACRRNLRKAREARKLNRLRQEIRQAAEKQRPYYQELEDWAVEKAVLSRERLADLAIKRHAHPDPAIQRLLIKVAELMPECRAR